MPVSINREMEGMTIELISKGDVSTIELQIPNALLRSITKYGEPDQVIMELLNRTFEQDNEIDLTSKTNTLRQPSIRFWDKLENRVRIADIIDNRKKMVSFMVGNNAQYRTFDDIEFFRPTPYLDIKKRIISEGDFLQFRGVVFVVTLIDQEYHLVSKETNQAICYLMEVSEKTEIVGNTYQERLQRDKRV